MAYQKGNSKITQELIVTRTLYLVASVPFKLLQIKKGYAMVSACWKGKTRFFQLSVCNPCQSSPSLAILVYLWFIIFSLVFSILVNYHFQVFFNLRVIFRVAKATQNIMTDLLWTAPSEMKLGETIWSNEECNVIGPHPSSLPVARRRVWRPLWVPETVGLLQLRGRDLKVF